MLKFTQIRSIYSGRSYSLETDPTAESLKPKGIEYLQNKLEETFPKNEINMWSGVLYLIKQDRIIVYSSMYRQNSANGVLGKKLLELSLKDENFLRPI